MRRVIKAVLFDFGLVISAPRPPGRFREYESELGIAEGTINQIMFDSKAWQEALVGRLSMQAFWYAIGPSLNLTTRARIDDFRRRYYGDEFADPSVLSLIRRLQGKTRLAVLSNHPPGLDQWLEGWQIRHFFEVVIASGDVGCAKPDPEIYYISLDRLGLRPHETVFIDDTPGHVTAAQAVGIHGIVFVGAPQLERDLSAALTV
jgi:putative hydrolase of the HAD superfamily